MRPKVNRPKTENSESAKDFVRRVLVEDFGQRVDADTLDSVTKKVLKSIPPFSEREKLRA